MSNSQKNKRIGIITGAAAGIGAAIAKKMVAQLDAVALLDINESGVHKITEELNTNYPGKAFAYPCNVGDSRAVQKALDVIMQEVGSPNILINNAGVGGPFHRVDEVSDEEWFTVINTNLKSVFNLCRIVLPLMKQQQYGRIVNIASIQGYLGAALSSTYVASKHGVIGYTRAIAAEWGQYNITCNAVCPGYVDTALGIQEAQVPTHNQKVLAKTPAGRIALSQEIANSVMFLIQEGSDFINGSVLTIDGGLSCHIGVS